MPVNPYVGPRSFQPGERLYGRDREAAELQDLLIAERIVLLYSPSGAGKTSLLQAKVLPAMAEAGFTVRPILRVGVEASIANGNRFIQACVDAFPQFLEKPGASELLVFDQFEEILTVDAGNREGKADFFRQLGDALRARNRWALFSMREDYIAGLDPYLKSVPTRFAATYRLDLLDRERAIEAIREPARASGIDFTLPAAQKLADDLRRGGPYVEPVQLQVVCLRLWEKKRPKLAEIAETDVGGAGDIDQALADYYADCVVQTVSGAAPERAIRDWFDRRLISKQGTRTQVLRGADQGLDGDAITALVNRHVVRSDQRHDTTWYELAHDRMIAPVQENNRQWREAHLSPLQRQAELWDEQKRQDGLLLRGGALTKAEGWTKSNPQLTGVEADFLAACRAERKRLRWKRTAIAMVAGLAVVAVAAFFIALTEMRVVGQQTTAANAARNTAVRAALNATAILEKDRQPALASLLAIESYRLGQNADSRSALLYTSQAAPRLARYLQGPADPQAVVFGPQGKTLITAGSAALVQFWDPQTGQKIKEWKSPCGAVVDLAVSPTGQSLAAVCAKKVVIWDLSSGTASVLQSTESSDGFRSIAFSPDGKRLAAAGPATDIVSTFPGVAVWDVASTHEIWSSTACEPVTSVAFSSDGAQLVASCLTSASIYSAGGAALKNVGSARRSIYDSFQFRPDGNLVASDGPFLSFLDGTLQASKTLRAPAAQNLSRFVLLKGSLQAAAIGDDNAITIWDASGQPQVLRSGIAPLTSLSYSPELGLLATSGGAIWDLTPNYLPPEYRSPAIRTPNVRSIAFSPDGQRLALVADQAKPQLWDVRSGNKLRDFGANDYTEYPSGIAFSPDGATLAASKAAPSAPFEIWLWDPATGARKGTAIGLPRPGVPDSLLSMLPYAAADGIAFSPDGKLVAAGGENRSFDTTAPIIWTANLTSTQATQVLFTENESQYDTVGVRSVAFSPDGKLLAAVAREQILVWDSVTRQIFKQWTVQAPQEVNSFAFSPGGDILAAAAGGSVSLSRVAAPLPPLIKITGHAGVIWDVTYNPDGSTLATVGDDGTIRFWNSSGAPLGDPLLQTGHHLWRVAYSRDEKTLAAAGEQGVYLLHANPDSWISRNCARANRNLTQAEWAKYIGAVEPYRMTCPNFPAGPR